MRKFLYLFAAVALASCGNFLEEQSNDLLIPKTLENFKEYLYGETMYSTANSMRFLTYLTDEVEEFYGPGREYRSPVAGYFMWSKEPECSFTEEWSDDQTWKEYYNDIFTCNIILNEIEKIECDLKEKNTFLAEVYFMKALRYFYLVNLYGEPYLDEAQAETALGVPVNNEYTIEDKQYRRSPLAENYRLIEEYLLHSIELFKRGVEQETIFRPSLNAAYLLASRVFLYTHQYDKAVAYADSVIARQGGLIGIVKPYSSEEDNYFLSGDNRGIVFSFDFWDVDKRGGAMFKKSSSSYKNYTVNSELLALYQNDLRREVFFGIGFGNYPFKYMDGTSTVDGRNFRIEEAFLNRAEARLMRDASDITLALADVNAIREHRITGVDHALQTTDAKEAMEWIRRERRMEFCFEDMRWFDIRRWQLPVVHKFTVDGHEQEYKLEPGAKNYTLPIPKKIRDKNPVIERLYQN